MKNTFIAGAVLLAVLVALYIYRRPKPLDPAVQRLSDLTDLAERSCLSNTNDTSSMSLRLSVAAIKSIDGSTSVEEQRTAARGAANALVGELQTEENREIRTCMEPWSKQIRDLASRL